MVHVRSIHKGVQFPCSHCELLFKHVNSLKRHIKSTHEREFFHCSDCNNKYTQKTSLSRHMKKTNHKTGTVKEETSMKLDSVTFTALDTDFKTMKTEPTIKQKLELALRKQFMKKRKLKKEIENRY